MEYTGKWYIDGTEIKSDSQKTTMDKCGKAIETFVDIKENILRYIFRQTNIKASSQKNILIYFIRISLVY